jgi:hypothetical protein
MKENEQEIFYEDTSHLDLKEAFFLLRNSVKLLISLTTIITLLGLYHAYTKEPQIESSILIEIGQYDSLTEKNLLLEKASNVIEDLKVVFIHKMFDRHSLKFIPLENRLIRINVVKSTFEAGNETLNEISEYLINRHALLLDNISKDAVKELAFDIENLNNQIEYSNQVFLSKLEYEELKIINSIDSLNDEITNLIESERKNRISEKLKIINSIERLNTEIPKIDLKIAALNAVIASESDNLLLLKSSPTLYIQRTSQSPTLDQIIFNYTSELIDYENEKTYVIKEIEFLQAKLKLLQNEELASEDVFKLSQEKNKLDMQLKLLQNEELASEDVFKLSQEKNKLEVDLKSLMDQNSTKTKLVGKIKSHKIGTRKVVIILLSFFAGLLFSVSIVFIRNALTKLKG